MGRAHYEEISHLIEYRKFTDGLSVKKELATLWKNTPGCNTFSIPETILDDESLNYETLISNVASNSGRSRDSF